MIFKRVGRSVRSRTRRSKDSWDLTAGVTHTALVGFRQGQLEDAEETAGRDPDGGEAQFTEEALPGLLTRCFPETLEDIQESLFPVGWQLDGLADGVHEPTQKDLEVQDPSFTSLDSERAPWLRTWAP
jgi:hypothetical protein